MSEFDDMVQELAQIDEKLRELPADAFNERITLHDRQNELRAEIHKAVPDYDHTRSTEEIKAELQGCQFTLDGVYSTEVIVEEQGMATGAGSASAAGQDAMNIDARIDKSGQLTWVQNRIDHLNSILEERGA